MNRNTRTGKEIFELLAILCSSIQLAVRPLHAYLVVDYGAYRFPRHGYLLFLCVQHNGLAGHSGSVRHHGISLLHAPSQQRVWLFIRRHPAVSGIVQWHQSGRGAASASGCHGTSACSSRIAFSAFSPRPGVQTVGFIQTDNLRLFLVEICFLSAPPVAHVKPMACPAGLRRWQPHTRSERRGCCVRAGWQELLGPLQRDRNVVFRSHSSGSRSAAGGRSALLPWRRSATRASFLTAALVSW